MSLRKNIVVNYLGRGWEALMGLAFVPLYIDYLGVEAWGLVGFLAMMQAWFGLLDMGFTPALSREMARFTAGSRSAESICDLLRSLEIIYAAVALVILVIIWCVASWLAEHWLNASYFSPDAVAQAIVIMGLVLATRMVEQVYRGVIQGLQQMAWLNGAQAVLATLRWAGAVVVLVYIESSIEAFFLWQAGVSLLSVGVLARQAYHYLPQNKVPARFDIETLLTIRRFAGGMAATAVLSIVLMQTDKLLLSKLVSLEEFGSYILAGTVAGALYIVIYPLTIAVSPRLTQLVAQGDEALLIDTYHRTSQLLAVIVVPLALVMSAFSGPLLQAWTNDSALAEQAAPLLSLLALGTMMNGIMHVPYMAQLAYGWTGFAVRVNVIAVAVLIPAILWFVPLYGASAAAWIWLILNTCYVFIGIHFMHRKILNNEKWRWYFRGVLMPLGVASLIVIVFRLFMPVELGRVSQLGYLFLSAAVAMILTTAISPEAVLQLKRFLHIKE